MPKRFKQNFIILLSFLILSSISIALLFHSHTIYGAFDMRFHLKRIIELMESYHHDNFLPHYAFNEFHGSSVLSLYPFLNLIPIILISIFTKSYINIIYLFIAFNIFVMLTISFYSSKSYNHSLLISYLFALSYSLSSMSFAYSFINMDLGVLSVLAFLPMIIFGFLKLINSNGSKWNGLTLGMTLIMYSHILSIIIISGFLLLWALINIKHIDKHIIQGIIYSILTAILLTSIIWIPLLTTALLNIGNIDPVAPSLIAYNITKIIELGVTDTPNFYISIIAVIGALLSILEYKHLTKYCKQMLWISIIILIMFSNIIPWRTLSNHLIIFKLLYLFQFTYRFCIIPQILLCYLFAITISKILFKTNFQKKSTCFLISLISLFIIGLQIYNQKEFIYQNSTNTLLTHAFISNKIKYITNNQRVAFNKFIIVHNKVINTNTRGLKFKNNKQLNLLCNNNLLSANSDYFPINSINKLQYINNNEGYYKNNHVIKVKNIGYNKFLFRTKNNIRHLNLPILHYNREHLIIYDNNKLEIPYTNKYDLISINHVTKGKHIIRIIYKPNIWEYVLILALFITGCIIIFIKRQK